MSESPPRHQWAARVSRYKIWQLYRADAAGRQDEELAYTDELSGPPELLRRLDEILRLPEPNPDCEF